MSRHQRRFSKQLDTKMHNDVPRSFIFYPLDAACFFFEIGYMMYLVLKAIVLKVYNVIFPPKERSCDGELVLITGSGSGIGRFIALEFANRNAKLVLLDINEKNNMASADLIRQAQPTADVNVYTCDVSNREDVYDVAVKIRSEVGDPEIIINNAGVVYGRTLMDTPDHLIEHTFAVNSLANFWMVKAFLPMMLQKERGHVVTIASVLGHTGATRVVDYCASKYAAIGFTESLSTELRSLGRSGIKTTLVCPTLIDTGLFEGVKIKFPWLTPSMPPREVSRLVVRAILTGQECIYLPKRIYLAIVLKAFLPAESWYTILDFLGVNSAMETFKGRAGSN